MSIVNIVLQREQAFLFTDTKCTIADGNQYSQVKFAQLPWLKMAVAVRGYVGALRVFERAIAGNALTYEGAVQFLVERFDDLLTAEYVDASEAFAMKQDLDVYIVGYGINGPAAHWISNYQTGGKVQRITDCHISPMVNFEAQKRFSNDVKAGMPQLMADQASQNPAVGGWGLCTEIRATHMLSYPMACLDGLAAVGSRMQPQEEKDALAAIEALNAERAARRAA